jgi:perosamine synthetase
VKIRRQLPAYSPLSLRATVAAAAQTVGPAEDPRPRLIELLKRKYAASDVVLTATGTQAMTLAIIAARDRDQKKRPVALPAYSCYDLASAALAADTAVTLYDVDPRTLAPDLASLESVLQAGAGTVIAAPLYGIPVDWDSLTALARSHGALVINDAAQCIGATSNGRAVAALGELAILSFGRGKGWTGGHGGALLLRDRDKSPEPTLPANVVDNLINVLGLAAQWTAGRPSLYGLPASIPALRLGETVYRPPESPREMGRVAAAAVLSTAAAAEEEAQVRQSNAAMLLDVVAKNPRLHVIKFPTNARPGYLRLPIRVANGIDAFGKKAAAEGRGIAAGYPTTLAELAPLRRHLTDANGRWPGAATLARELITAPTHSLLSPADLTDLSDLLRSI